MPGGRIDCLLHLHEAREIRTKDAREGKWKSMKRLN